MRRVKMFLALSEDVAPSRKSREKMRKPVMPARSRKWEGKRCMGTHSLTHSLTHALTHSLTVQVCGRFCYTYHTTQSLTHSVTEYCE
jgi:hypothetical protein